MIAVMHQRLYIKERQEAKTKIAQLKSFSLFGFNRFLDKIGGQTPFP